MAKRRSETGEPIPHGMRGAIEPATVSPETAAPEASVPELPFELGTWKGLRQWRCRRCPWDTLAGEEALRAHIQEVHEPPMQPPSPPLVAVSDRWGREVRPLQGASREPTEAPPSEGVQ